MDLDSDYCSNDSDRTPTPPSHHHPSKTTQHNQQHHQQQQQQHGFNNVRKPRNGENLFKFVVGKPEERIMIREKELVHLIKSNQWIAKLVVTSKHVPTHEIQVPDWDVRSFKLFLTFMHTEQIKPEELTEFGEIIRLCLKYNVRKMLAQVCAVARQSISLDNCVELYNLGSFHEIEELRISAYSYMQKMGNAFVEHPKFLELDCITVSLLTCSDELAVEEITLFRRLKDWVVAQCKQLGYPPDRKEFFGRVAGLLFTHVRYSQMTPKEFKSEVVPSGLLNAKDIEGINLRHKTHPNHWYALEPHQFIDRPRLIKLQFAVPLYNNVQIGFRKIPGASRTIQESVRFMVSHDIYLISVGFFGPAKNVSCPNGTPLSPYSIKIHVEGDYSKYHCRCPPQNATVVTRDNFSVDLSNPFKIQRMQPYKLTVWIDGDVSQFGVFPLPQAVVLMQDKGPGGLITFHFGDADNDPQPSLPLTGRPSSAAPLILQHQNIIHNPIIPSHPPHPPPPHHPHHLLHPPNNRLLQPFRPPPRSSGVIRCINFTVKD